MLTVYNCIVQAHDLRLVGLAAAICLLASFTAVNLLHHVRGSEGRMRTVWLGVAATSTGFGIWATHFIAMLAFSPGIPSAYNIVLTFLSLIAAIVLTGAGLAIALHPKIPAGAWLGGAVVGGGIAAMHYTGMAAFEIQGWILWDPVLVTASIVLGALLGAVALPVGLRNESPPWKIAGALLLTVAICSHHFTAMAAAAIIPDPSVEVSPEALPSGLLAVAVAFASFIIIVLALSAVALDLRDRRRAEREADRMQGLANAAVEGLLVCDGETVVTVNESFTALIGAPAEALAGASLQQLFPDEAARLKLRESAGRAIEGELLKADGTQIPVELIRRPVDFAGKPHCVVAVRDLRARKHAEQHIRFLAHNDSLTGIPNRSTFNNRLDQEIALALADGQKLAVLCLDLDRFKEVNDLFGHATGDRMLQSVAKRIAKILDDGQTVARLSGDEFAIIVPNLANASAAGRVAERVLEALKASDETGSTEMAVSTSIGIAICPDDAAERQALLTHADTALYRAKHDGRGLYRFFIAAMGAAVHDRRLLEHDLRQAVARGELRLVYQPLQEIPTGRVVGFEALLRWRHPTRGEVPPADFVPIAEEIGSILPIGEWVLREACREAATWRAPLTVAVNVSAVQIHSANFAHAVHEILFETGLDPARLELEVTETALVRDLNRALATLRRIKMLGVRIAMDDFGTGYSSLSNLRAFPFDKIKIDRSFIKQVNVNSQAAAIVRSVLGLGRALGLPVLAEGVETAAEFAFLENENCNEAQGYLLGRPADIANFSAITRGEASAAGSPVVVPLSKAVSQ